MLKGTYTALVTPFKEGRVDSLALQLLIEEQVAAEVEGIALLGTTGESSTITQEEREEIIKVGVQVAAGRTKVWVGTGSNCTHKTIELTKQAQELRADGALLVAPYYSKPQQQGLYEHFMVVAQASDLPLMLYSIPGRCGVEIGVETMVRLAQDVSNIVALKEAGGSVERVSRLRQALPESFSILSGDDGLTLPFMSVGAVGVVSVASNVVPGQVKSLVDALLDGHLMEAERLHRRLYPLFCDLFVETNPVPVKAALAALGKIGEEVRLPLVKLSDSSRAKLKTAMKQVGLI